MPKDQPPPIVSDAPDRLALLAAALAGPQLRDSPRQCALLRYLVAEELAGRGDRLNAYSVAFDVLNRDASFDPATDSNVRVEMHRLRQNLEAWNQDPANTLSHGLDLPTRSYRVQVTPRADASAGQGRAVTTQTRWIRLLAALAMLVALGGLIAWFVLPSASCRSARPTVTLPTGIENVDASTSNELLDRLETFLGNYPLVSALRGHEPACQGAPGYDLKIRASAQGLEASLAERSTKAVIWSHLTSLRQPATAQSKDLAIAQIAYLVGYDTGAIPIDAQRRGWTNQTASEEYRCLMQAHQYFATNAQPSFYLRARDCLIQFYDQSYKADVPALLAAIEFESLLVPGLSNGKVGNYYSRAIAAANRIDPYNSELLMIRLRNARIGPHPSIGDAHILLSQMEQVYPLEPHVLYQVAMARCSFTQDYEKAKSNIRTLRLIAGDAIKLNLAEIYCNIATGHSKDNGSYIDELLIDPTPFYQLLALDYARTARDQKTADKVLYRLDKMGCASRECTRNAVTANAFNSDIWSRLFATIDEYYPDRMPPPEPVLKRSGPARP